MCSSAWVTRSRFGVVISLKGTKWTQPLTSWSVERRAPILFFSCLEASEENHLVVSINETQNVFKWRLNEGKKSSSWLLCSYSGGVLNWWPLYPWSNPWLIWPMSPSFSLHKHQGFHIFILLKFCLHKTIRKIKSILRFSCSYCSSMLTHSTLVSIWLLMLIPS